MNLLHLTASRFIGGPERQILELANEFAASGSGVENTICSFREDGLCRPFLAAAAEAGHPCVEIPHDHPRLLAAVGDVARLLRRRSVDVLLVNGYKAGLVGWLAARSCGVPVVGVSRGWTAENAKVRLYERLDRWLLRRMDRVVCVSAGQAEKVAKRANVPRERIAVIHNSIRTERFEGIPDPAYRARLEAFFEHPPEIILGAAGRLSPEKGFDLLIDAVGQLADRGLSLSLSHSLSVGLVLFGEGFLRESLEAKINASSLVGRVVLAGFTDELDAYLPHFDAFVQSSHSEGLPNVILEAMAAGVPVVATAVGGTSELITHDRTGLLVPPPETGPSAAASLAEAVGRLATDPALRARLAAAARHRVETQFTFPRQAAAYTQLLTPLARRSGTPCLTATLTTNH